MRKLFVLLGTTAMVFGTAGTAGASVLNWEGTITLLRGLEPLPDFSLRGGGVATINSSNSLGHLQTLRLLPSRGHVRGQSTYLVTDPDVLNSNLGSFRVNLSATTGTFAPISGAAGARTVLTQNTMGLNGTLRFCFILGDPDCDSLVLDLLQTTVNGAKHGIGIGGSIAATFSGLGINAGFISIQAAPWTIKTATLTELLTTLNEGNALFVTKMFAGFAHDAASGTTSTAAPSGVVQLVSPSLVRTNLPPAPVGERRVASGTYLLIHFIPEPDLLLLLGSGIAGLAVLGRRRWRS